jgi:hypothetical protein
MQPGSPAYDARLRQWCADLDRLGATVRRPVPTCEGCRHFQRDRINPPAGAGNCLRGQGSWHPMAPHYCRKREAL